MIRNCKWLFLGLFLLCGDVAFTVAPMQYNAHSSNDEFVYPFSIVEHIPASFPSHGFALLILRYNESNNDKINPFLLSNPVMQRSVHENSIARTGANVSKITLLFPEKRLKYKVFLCSLPLRSPPIYC